MRGLLGVGEGLQLVDETPREARAQVLAQGELRRRLAAGGEHRRRALARGVDRGEKTLLRRSFELLDIVGEHEARIRAARSVEKVSTATSRLAPQIEHRLARRSGGEVAHRCDGLGVRPGDEVVEIRLERRPDVEDELLHLARIPI